MINNSNNMTAILLVNLGTPDQPYTKEVRTYLKEFLSDKDVIRLPRIFWLPLLHLIILRFRPKKSAELYRNVWTKWGSPLMYNTFLQAGLLRRKLTNDNFFVDVAMRYGKPSLEKKILDIKTNGFKKVIVIPMFPQYSTTTTRSIARQIDKVISKHNIKKNDLSVSFIKHFFNNDQYVSAAANSIRKYQDAHGKPDKLLLSFHGIPKSYIAEDEPYQEQCFESARLIANKMGLKDDEYEVVFQSRFGKAEWIQPYLASRLEELPNENIKNIHIFCPGFVSDCLETIDEIGEESKELFMENGGNHFGFIPCLNGADDFIKVLENLILSIDENNTDYKSLF